MGRHKTQRTEALRQAIARRRLDEQACNHIEQHNFDRLVRNGVIIEAQAEDRLLCFGHGPSEKPAPEAAISTYESLKY